MASCISIYCTCMLQNVTLHKTTCFWSRMKKPLRFWELHETEEGHELRSFSSIAIPMRNAINIRPIDILCSVEQTPATDSGANPNLFQICYRCDGGGWTAATKLRKSGDGSGNETKRPDISSRDCINARSSCCCSIVFGPKSSATLFLVLQPYFVFFLLV